MKFRISALAVLASMAVAGISFAAEGPFKGRTPAVGQRCQNNTHFDITATVDGAKVEILLEGSAFQRGPTKIAGDATATGFSAAHVYPALNNLRVEISGTRVDADTYTVATKWAGGGPSNCESTGTAKKV